MDETKKKRNRNVFDRIVLAPESQEVLTRLIAEISESTNGLLNLQRRELANFLIQIRSKPLDAKELSEIRAKFFDDTKAANWMVNQIRQARSQGETVDLEELFKKVRMQSVAEIRTPKEVRRKKSRSVDEAPASPDGEVNLGPTGSDKAPNS